MHLPTQVVRCRLGPELLGRLFRYQSDGVVAGVRFEGRLLLADEMGLGKTVQVSGCGQSRCGRA